MKFKNHWSENMKTIFLTLTILVQLISCKTSKEKGNDTTLLGALLLASRPTSGSGGGGAPTQMLYVTSLTSSSSTVVSGNNLYFTLNISSSSNPKDYTLNLYFSTDSTVNTMILSWVQLP